MIFLVRDFVAQRGDLGDWLHDRTGKAGTHKAENNTHFVSIKNYIFLIQPSVPDING